MRRHNGQCLGSGPMRMCFGLLLEPPTVKTSTLSTLLGILWGFCNHLKRWDFLKTIDCFFVLFLFFISYGPVRSLFPLHLLINWHSPETDLIQVDQDSLRNLRRATHTTLAPLIGSVVDTTGLGGAITGSGHQSRRHRRIQGRDLRSSRSWVGSASSVWYWQSRPSVVVHNCTSLGENFPFLEALLDLFSGGCCNRATGSSSCNPGCGRSYTRSAMLGRNSAPGRNGASGSTSSPGSRCGLGSRSSFGIRSEWVFTGSRSFSSDNPRTRSFSTGLRIASSPRKYYRFRFGGIRLFLRFAIAPLY